MAPPDRPGDGSDPEHWDVDALWARHRKKLVSRPAPVRVVPTRPGPLRRVALAAAVLVALGVGLATGSIFGDLSWPLGRAYVTAPGQRLNLTLSDGTQVALAPGTRLRVPWRYGRTRRDVTLQGEAFFSVVHDTTMPFRVRAGRAEVTDVGTAFDVRAYEGDTTLTVAVADGVVALDARDHAPLVAGDVARVSGDGAIATMHGSDLAPYVGWTRGQLVFRDTPLRDVLSALARWYGVTITLGDPELATRTLRATYDTRSMTDVLTLVTSTVGAHYTRVGRTITVLPGLAP
jgi:transmembrane sensor